MKCITWYNKKCKYKYRKYIILWEGANFEDIKEKADEIMRTGVKVKDAYHVACAIYADCDCFFTTDDRLLKYTSEEIQMLNPIDFIRRWEEEYGK